MEASMEQEPLIDPEVRATILSLVNALGGSSAGVDGRYVLGDEALPVLKDIKKWLRLYDDRTNRLDVARLLAECNCFNGDLLEILACTGEDDLVGGGYRGKIALLCVDLMTQLTWPIERDELRTGMHHFLHIPYLEQARASYKQAILHHPAANLLQTVVRVGLPSIAQQRSERSHMEENIIKVVLYFFRNIAMIVHPKDLAVDEMEGDISRSATVDAFHYQEIFSLVLTLCSCITEQFDAHDVECLEILFHLLKGVSPERLFMDNDELLTEDTKSLQNLMSKEKTMRASYARHAPSRHNKWGSMVWVKRTGEDPRDAKYSTVFGLAALTGEQMGLQEMDKSKKWKKPRRPVKRDLQDHTAGEFNTTVNLTSSASRHLRSFVEQFLDSSFNPLFTAVRRAIEVEATRVLDAHTRQYLYLVSWFLRAECARQRKQATDRQTQAPSDQTEVESFTLVASVLNQETFVLLNRSLQKAQDEKSWQDLNAGMRCFAQILLTVQEMCDSPLDDDQDIAENILSRIFYEQSTHDRIITLLKSYKDQGFGYLDSVTNLAYTFLRLLERYSKQNVDMQVRTRRRARKKKQKEAEQMNNANEDREAEAEDFVEAHRVSSERKFDFSRFAARFVSQSSVDTHVALLRYYGDLSDDQLKRVHRFFYRVAFKMEVTTLLFRMDVIALLNKVVKGPHALDPDNANFKDWEELARQLFRRLVKRMQDRPALALELLFSKIPSSMYFLEHGYDVTLPKKVYRAPAELEVKPGMDRKDEIAVAVGVLINQSKSDLLSWVKSMLEKTAEDRKRWEDDHPEAATLNIPIIPPANISISVSEDRQSTENEERTVPADEPAVAQSGEPERPKPSSTVVRADTKERTKALGRDKHLRLLFTLLDFQHFATGSDTEDSGSTEEGGIWLIPSNVTSSQLLADMETINRTEFSPPTYDDGKSAEDFVRRKTLATERSRTTTAANGESDSEGSLGPEFAPGGPTTRHGSPSPDRTKPTRQRTRHEPDVLLDDRVLDERREAKRKREMEKNRKIKSRLRVTESDDEDDLERDVQFFRAEEERRRKYGMGIVRDAQIARERAEAANQRQGKGKRKSASADLSTDESDTEQNNSERSFLKRRRILTPLLSDIDDDSIQSTSGAPSEASTPREQTARSLKKSNPGPATVFDENDSEASTETETPPTSQRPSTGQSNKPAPPFTAPEADGQSGADDGESDKENQAVRIPTPSHVSGVGLGIAMSKVNGGRRGRGAFVVESDSDE